MSSRRDDLEYLAARTLIGGLGVLPAPAALAFGGLLGAAAWRAGARRDIVRDQIAAAFPGRDLAWVEATARASYRHFGREAVEMVRLQRTGIERLPARVTGDDGCRRWIDRMASGVGTLVVTGHLGNWETAGAYLAASGVPLAAIVKRQRNRKFDRWLAESRRRIGIEPIYRDEARRRVPRLLAEGRSIALVADQDALSGGMLVTFLGRPASTFRGPARLALATGAPLVFGGAWRDGEGYRVSIEAVGAGPAAGAETPEPTERRLTEEWVAHLERLVRAHPEQYFWFHRRWKSGIRRVRNDDGGGGVPHAERGEMHGEARERAANPSTGFKETTS